MSTDADYFEPGSWDLARLGIDEAEILALLGQLDDAIAKLRSRPLVSLRSRQALDKKTLREAAALFRSLSAYLDAAANVGVETVVSRRRVTRSLRRAQRVLSRRLADLVHDQDEVGRLARAVLEEEGSTRWEEKYMKRVALLEVELQGRKMTRAEVLSLFHSADAETRRTAFTAICATLSADAGLYAQWIDKIFSARRDEDRRHRRDALDALATREEMTRAEVETLLAVLPQTYPLSQRLLRVKWRLLGVSDPQMADVFALPEPRPRLPLSEVLGETVKAFSSLAPKAGQVAARLIEEGRVDAAPRLGKPAEGFCLSLGRLGPLVSVPYEEDLPQALTIAHELGHALHFSLAEESEGFLVVNTLLSETVSLLAERLLLERLLEQLPETADAARSSLLVVRAHRALATTARRALEIFFEQRLYEIAVDKALTPELISSIWRREHEKLFDVALPDWSDIGWTAASTLAQRRFNTFSYAAAELLALCLARRLTLPRGDLGERLVTVMAAGGSRPLPALLHELDLNLGPATWREGLSELEKIVEEAERCVDSYLAGLGGGPG